MSNFPHDLDITSFPKYIDIIFLWTLYCFNSVQSLSCVQLFATTWTSARQVSLSITNSRSLLKLISIESVMPSNHLILCHPLLLPSILPASGSFPSSQFFASGSQMSFNFIISLFNEYSGLISFRMDWLYLLVILLSNTITPINSLKGIRT